MFRAQHISPLCHNYEFRKLALGNLPRRIAVPVEMKNNLWRIESLQTSNIRDYQQYMFSGKKSSPATKNSRHRHQVFLLTAVVHFAAQDGWQRAHRAALSVKGWDEHKHQEKVAIRSDNKHCCCDLSNSR